MKEKVEFTRLTGPDSRKTLEKRTIPLERFNNWLMAEKGISKEWAKTLSYYANRILMEAKMPNPDEEVAREIASRVLRTDASKSCKRAKLIALEYWMQYMGKKIHFKKPNQTKRNPRYLTEEQMRQLIHASLNYRDAAILEVFCTTGIRSNELRMLNLGDIDWANGVILIRCGKRDKEREVFLTDECRRFLTIYIEKWIPMQEKTSERPLFLSMRKGRISKNAISEIVRQTAKRAGLPPTSPHVLRHSYATCYASKNRDVFVLQELMGHSDLEMTKRYYHGNREMKRNGAIIGAPSLL